MNPHDPTFDINCVTITGLIAETPLLQIIPPGATLYLSFPLLVRCLLPDHTGMLAPFDHVMQCLATGTEAERCLCVEEGDAVEIRGSLDLVYMGDSPAGPTQPDCSLAVRIQDLIAPRKGRRHDSSDHYAE